MRHIHNVGGSRRDAASKVRIKEMKSDRLVLFQGIRLRRHIVFYYGSLVVIQNSAISPQVRLRGGTRFRGGSNGCEGSAKGMVWGGQKEKRGRKGGIFKFLPNEAQLFYHLWDVMELQFLTNNLLVMAVPNGVC